MNFHIPSMRGTRLAAVAALALMVPATLAACGSDSGSSSGNAASGASGSKVDAVAKLVPDEVRSAGVLRVAVPDGSPPLASVNAAGKPEGMDVDLANALGQVM